MDERPKGCDSLTELGGLQLVFRAPGDLAKLLALNGLSKDKQEVAMVLSDGSV